VIFRREPLHKKLAREARLEQEPEAEPVDPGPHWGVTGIHGVPRPRRWDAVGSAYAPGLTGDEVHFVALPGGDLVVDEDVPGDTLGPLAETIEQTIEPPYGPREFARAPASGRLPHGASKSRSSRPKATRSSWLSPRTDALWSWTERGSSAAFPSSSLSAHR